MIPAHPLSAFVTVLVLAWLSHTTAQGHESPASAGHHETHGERAHTEHRAPNHEEHRETHPEERHMEHHDAHHDEHRDPHDDLHHYDPHHYDPHHYDPNHYDPNHYDPHHFDPHHYDPHHYDPHHYDPYHNPDWYRHLSHHEWWHHHSEWHHRPWWAWWNHPAWTDVSTWFGGWGWSRPIYYNYGDGGNVVYQDQTVYVQGQPVGTAAEFAQSAASLASVNAPDSPADQGDWLSLGTFALSKHDADESPTQVVQLAVNKAGAISGVLYDLSKDNSLSVHGSVDKATQRAAFTLNEKGSLIAETGISNLTQRETSLLVHEGATKRELYRLTRLDSPPSAWQDSSHAVTP